MNVLILASYFDGQSTGSLRMFDLAKYLYDKGCKVSILTPDENTMSFGGEIIQFSDHFEDKIKHEPLAILYKALRKAVYCIWGIGFHPKYSSLLKSDYSNFDVVIASSPQPELLDLALKIKKINKIKFIADFRDGLLFEPLRPYNFLEKFKFVKLERKVCSAADLVVSVSSEITSYFKNTYSVENAVTIPNGFRDWNDNVKNEIGVESNPMKPIEILYTGNISKSRSSLFSSLKVVVKAYDLLSTEQKERLSIKFVGSYSKNELELISGRFNVLPKVERETALKMQSEADYFLLFTGLDKSVLTGKLFEYLSCRKPIIGITNSGSAEYVIHSTESGTCFNHQQISELFNYLSNLKRLPKMERYKVNDFKRSILNERYVSEIFNIK